MPNLISGPFSSHILEIEVSYGFIFPKVPNLQWYWKLDRSFDVFVLFDSFGALQ